MPQSTGVGLEDKIEPRNGIAGGGHDDLASAETGGSSAPVGGDGM